MPSYREECGRELLCILHEDWPGAQGVDCVRHCYMMPEGGYQSNGSQDTQEQEGGLDSDTSTNAHLQELVKVGRAEIREVKTDIRSGNCYNCAN